MIANALLLSFAGSLLICMALIPALTASAWKLQFVDVPRDRRMHAEPIAKVGGIAFAAGTIAAVLLWAPNDHLILASVLGGVVILLFGIWDDWVELNPRMKFAGQILAAGVVVFFAGVQVTAVPFFDDVTLPLWTAAPLTVFVIVGMTNAVNLADGLDGLAGGLSLLSFAGIAYLANQAGDQMLMLLMVAVLGGLLGFLRFNTYPARVFMGDAGSQFLGHYLAVAALILIDPVRGPYSPLIVLFLWGVPLLDTMGVMVQRYREGRALFVGDRNHIHHKLLAMGLTHRQAVTVIYAAQSVSIGCAAALCWQSDAVILCAYAVFAGVVLSVFRFSPRAAKDSGPVVLRSEAAPAIQAARTWPLRGLRWVMSGFLAVCAFLPATVPHEARWVAAGLLAGVAGAVVLGTWAPLMVRVGLYVGSTFILYYSELGPPMWMLGHMALLNAGFVALALLVALAIRFTGEDRFQTTPLDYLVMLLALMLPLMPHLMVGDVSLSVLTAKLIVLFFAYELLLQVSREAAVRIEWLTAWMLAGLAARAWDW